MNIYLKRYNRLIAYYKFFDVIGYSEKHHIVPRCMGGGNEKENIVKLPAKAHYIAHHLLYKAFPENQKLANAFGMMLCGGDHQERRFSAKMYEQARTALSHAKVGIKRPDLAERNRSRRMHPVRVPVPRTPNRDAFKEYNERKRLEGFTEQELENKRKAGKARRGVEMSLEGKASYSRAAIKRYQNAPIIKCCKCGHEQKRSPNFYRNHDKNCRA